MNRSVQVKMCWRQHYPRLHIIMHTGPCRGEDTIRDSQQVCRITNLPFHSPELQEVFAVTVSWIANAHILIVCYRISVDCRLSSMIAYSIVTCLLSRLWLTKSQSPWQDTKDLSSTVSVCCLRCSRNQGLLTMRETRSQRQDEGDG